MQTCWKMGMGLLDNNHPMLGNNVCKYHRNGITQMFLYTKCLTGFESKITKVVRAPIQLPWDTMHMSPTTYQIQPRMMNIHCFVQQDQHTTGLAGQ
jgi:hypothetical protein